MQRPSVSIDPEDGAEIGFSPSEMKNRSRSRKPTALRGPRGVRGKIGPRGKPGARGPVGISPDHRDVMKLSAQMREVLKELQIQLMRIAQILAQLDLLMTGQPPDPAERRAIPRGTISPARARYPTRLSV